jgi:hypothetical protein
MYGVNDQIERNEMGGTYSTYGGEEKRGEAYTGFWCGRPWRRWEDNIKMDLLEVGCGSIEWTELAQDRNRWRELVNPVMNLRFHNMWGIS